MGTINYINKDGFSIEIEINSLIFDTFEKARIRVPSNSDFNPFLPYFIVHDDIDIFCMTKIGNPNAGEESIAWCFKDCTNKRDYHQNRDQIHNITDMLGKYIEISIQYHNLYWSSHDQNQKDKVLLKFQEDCLGIKLVLENNTYRKSMDGFSTNDKNWEGGLTLI